jgi:PPK2 family polyphosphate:nucleotide phosphotransferase
MTTNCQNQKDPMIDSPYLVEPGKKLKLSKCDTNDKGQFKDREDAEKVVAKNLAKLAELQEVLYAESKRSILLVFQAMDAGGKDGAISHIFSGVNPQGCQVTSFKSPSTLERSHDFLWRIHQHVPPRGMIGIFNRSHYEDVLIVRVHNLVPKEVWGKRFDHINNFERMLSDEGTVILKFFLHISKEEQKCRLEARLKDPEKHWKFNPEDLDERKLWDDYMNAFEDALEKTSTKKAPWYVVPSDRKWFRNWVISDMIVRAMTDMNLKFPEPPAGLDKIKIV